MPKSRIWTFLLAVSMDGVFYIPCYDHNGNIVRYVSETGGNLF